jgi:hypothetical protein
MVIQSVRTALGINLASCAVGTSDLCPVGEAAGVVLRLRNAWSLYSTLPCAYVVWYFTEHREIYSFTITQYYLSPLFFLLSTQSSFCMIELADFAESCVSISMGGYKECGLISAVCL